VGHGSGRRGDLFSTKARSKLICRSVNVIIASVSIGGTEGRIGDGQREGYKEGQRGQRSVRQ
jgi:hypothetical protein